MTISERDLDRRARIEVAGQVAQGIAHDFNHTIGIVKNYVAFLGRDIGIETRSLPRVKEDFKYITEAIGQAENLARALMALSHTQTPNPTVFNLNDVITDVQPLVDSFSAINPQYDLDPDLWPMRADRGQVEQVILNLALNSRDALGETGGILVISTTNIEAEDYFVRLTIRDNGPGIEPEIVDRIFDPFFTTKKATNGGGSTGLGLATVYGIVKNAGGFIDVKANPGEGAEFKITFPAGGGWPSHPERRSHRR